MLLLHGNPCWESCSDIICLIRSSGSNISTYRYHFSIRKQNENIINVSLTYRPRQKQTIPSAKLAIGLLGLFIHERYCIMKYSSSLGLTFQPKRKEKTQLIKSQAYILLIIFRSHEDLIYRFVLWFAKTIDPCNLDGFF